MLTKTKIKEIQRTITEEHGRLPMVFGALGDPGRFRIFHLLTKQKDICVTDVASIFGISVPAASQQLRVLEMCGLVRKERMGQMICYEIRRDDALVKSLMKFFS